MVDRKRGHVRFGPFDMDLGTGELRKHGIKILLQSQPFDVLAVLVERPGELVTREELKTRTWGDDTYIDFDQGVNKAIKKIRAALGDSAGEPKYIETLAKRGYRFIASVGLDCENAPAIDSNLSVNPPETSPPMPKPAESAAVQVFPLAGPRRKRWRRAVAAGAVVSAVGLVLTLLLVRRQPEPRRDLKPQQLTTNPEENFLASAILSPDGKYLLYGDQIGIHLRLIATGETHPFEKPAALSPNDSWFPTAWFPDQARFIAVSEALTPVGLITKSWIVKVLGGAVSELRADAYAHSVSPDGTLIAYTAGLYSSQEIWVTGARGEDAKRITANDPSVAILDLQWSPDGRRLADLTLGAKDGSHYVIESRDLQGGPPTTVVSVVESPPGFENARGFSWLPDSRVIYALAEPSPDVNDANLWEIAVEAKTGRPLGQPRRLTNWFSFRISGLSRSRDGKRMVLRKSSTQYDVYVGAFDASGHLQTPRRLTLEESNDLPMTWTPDSKSVVFTSDRNGSYCLYKQEIEQTAAEPITTGPDVNMMARISPDNRWILYASFPKGGSYGPGRLMRVPVAGGPSEVVMKLPRSGDIGCPLYPATRCLSLDFTDDKQEIITSFDPIRGDAREVFRNNSKNGFSYGGNWGLSPDGSQIAAIEISPQAGWIRFVSLSGKLEQKVLIKGCVTPHNLDWSADGKSMYISCYSPRGSTILRVDRTGQAQPLSQIGGVSQDWAIPSPNGRYLAIMGDTTSSNAWLLEKF